MKHKKLWFWLMTVSSVIYILWRLFFTLPLDYGIVALVAGIALFSAEFISMLEAVIHYICMSKDKEPEFPVIQEADYPHVDVLIATHSEEADLLFKTVNGCKHMDYPDKSKVHIYLCDDNNRAEIAKLAKDMGVGYFGLSDNKLAKAGNLNNALSKTDSPLVVTFDADMIPRSNFLMETIPYFSLPEMILNDGKWRKRTEEEIDPDYKIGFIQTPQSFYNPDLFQFNFFAESNIPNEQDYFFKEVNVGRNSSNSVIYAGSNTVISRKALEEVGGIRTKTITEDFATGIDIQAKGYTCFAIDKVLASGLAPDDFPNLLKQRQRWGRGCVQTIRSFKFLFGKLPFISKLSYLSSLLYWWTFLRRIIYILSPILFTVFGVLVVKTDLWGILLIWLPSYLIYNHSLRLLSGKIRDQKWSNIVDTILCPYMIFPILAETLGIRMKKFSVTNKSKTVSRSAKIIYAIPHMILLAASIVGIYFSIKNIVIYKNILGLVVLFWLCMNTYFLSMAIFFLLGRINYRSSERFRAEIPVTFSVGIRKVNGITCDISENGLAFTTEFPEFVHGVVSFELQDKKWSAKVPGEIVHVSKFRDKWRYSVKLTDLSFEEKQNYDQIVYDRVPTLATEIKTNAFKDLLVFFKRKTAHSVLSKRKLPRIVLNTSLQAVDGSTVHVADYNYQYMLITGAVPASEFDLKMGNTILHLKKNQSAIGGKDNLFEIENWESISASVDLHEALLELIQEKKMEENELVHA
ncbi:MAG: glycosyltransferase family 2 protein [Eubacteriales bacterium]|nr:glycosyltransferase family 2 protein [Eubacteriales bacterium]